MSTITRLLGGLLVLVMPTTAGATTFFTATTGNNSHTCIQAQSASTPKLTIAGGASCLTPGDTLIVKVGVYAEQLTDAIPGGSSWSAPVTVIADAGATVTIRPGAGQDGALYFNAATSQFIVIDGFEIDGTGETNGHGIYITNLAHHIRVQNSNIHHFYNQGILVSGSGGSGTTSFSNNNEFLSLYVHDNGTRTDTAPNLDHGIYIETDNNVVADSNIYNHTGHGVHIYSGNSWQPDFNQVRQNLVYDNTTIGIGSYGGNGNSITNCVVLDSESVGIKVSGTNTDVSNNTIYSIVQFGGYSESGSGHLWRNNIITHSGDWGLWLAAGVTPLTVQNNLFYLNSDGPIENEAGATITGTVLTDPLFVSVGPQDSGNFALQNGSPAIDAGVTISAIIVDYSGLARPQGLGYDIGAHEYASTLLPRRDGHAWNTYHGGAW